MVDAVIFDCDGVLVDSEALGLEESAQYLRSHGFTWSAADLVKKFTGLRDDRFALLLSEAYRDIHGASPPPDFFDGLVAERRSRKDELTEVAGAALALERLSAANVPFAVASSSRTPYLESKLKRTGLWPLAAPHVYSADRVANGKPAPDIFLHAAQRIDAAPGACLVVEDSPNGVKAGVAAGMIVCGFIGGGHCYDGHDALLLDAGANFIAADFSTLLERALNVSE